MISARLSGPQSRNLPTSSRPEKCHPSNFPHCRIDPIWCSWRIWATRVSTWTQTRYHLHRSYPPSCSAAATSSREKTILACSSQVWHPVQQTWTCAKPRIGPPTKTPLLTTHLWKSCHWKRTLRCWNLMRSKYPIASEQIKSKSRLRSNKSGNMRRNW